MRPCARSPRCCPARRSWSPNRPFRSAPAMRSSAFFAKNVPTPSCGRLQPGILARGRRHPGFQASRSHRGRHRRCARARRARRNLSAALSECRADHLCQPAHGRADQIRGQRLPRHQNHLHQRDRRSVRARRRRRAGGGARHGPRQPHRRQISACRPRLRRFVLPQGRDGVAQDRARPRRRIAHRRDGVRGQRSAQARHGAQGGRSP